MGRAGRGMGRQVGQAQGQHLWSGYTLKEPIIHVVQAGSGVNTVQVAAAHGHSCHKAGACAAKAGSVAAGWLGLWRVGGGVVRVFAGGVACAWRVRAAVWKGSIVCAVRAV